MCFLKWKIEEKRFASFLNKKSRSNECFLCGKKIESPCNSHIVSQFILREIAEDGKVAYGYALHKFKVEGFDKITGINNAHTFRLICRDCDQKFFSDYENPDNLMNFDNLPIILKNKILSEMALKSHLSHINMKYRRLVSKDVLYEGKIAKMEEEGTFFTAERLDLDEHFNYVDKLKKSIRYNNSDFDILYNEVLDYKTKLATQTIINFNYDLEGYQIFDPYNLSHNNQCRYFYLMIIPYKNKTRVLFYIEKKNTRNVASLIKQFNFLSNEDKLHFLFISLIIHDQQFYMAPSFANEIFKKDKKMVSLYIKTEESINYQSKLKDFKKYKNYLSEEYSKKG